MQKDDINEDLLNDTQDVPEDIDIQPDQGLKGYQDELDTNPRKQDVVEYEQSKEAGNDPADFMQMPRDVLKEELDSEASDEQQQFASDDYVGPEGTSDDIRESIEDLNEADKDDR